MSKKFPQLEAQKAHLDAMLTLLDQSQSKDTMQLLAELKLLAETSRAQIEQALQEEPFDSAVYTKKLHKLWAYSQELSIESLKDLPRDCELVVHKTYIKKKNGKFWKDAIIKVTNKHTGHCWYQTIKIQEFDQLDSHSAFKEIGQEYLPVRLSAERLEVAIGIRNPVGALGQLIFYCLGGSTSRPNPSVFQQWPAHKLALDDKVRRDANRLSGQIKTGIALVADSDLADIDDAKEKMVWFTIPELKMLQKEPQFRDASTKYLAEYLLGHQDEIRAALVKLNQSSYSISK